MHLHPAERQTRVVRGIITKENSKIMSCFSLRTAGWREHYRYFCERKKYLSKGWEHKENHTMKTGANLCSCQSLDIIALPWYNGSPGPLIFPLRLYLRYLEGFPSAPDFSRETSQTEMTMDFQWLIIMPLSCTISRASFALRLIWV